MWESRGEKASVQFRYIITNVLNEEDFDAAGVLVGLE